MPDRNLLFGMHPRSSFLELQLREEFFRDKKSLLKFQKVNPVTTIQSLANPSIHARDGVTAVYGQAAVNLLFHEILLLINSRPPIPTRIMKWR